MEFKPDKTPGNILAEQTRLLYASARMPIIVSVMAAVLLVGIMWTVIDHTALLIWLFSLLIISSFRFRLLSIYSRVDPGEINTKNWHLRFLIGNYIAAFIWGISSFVIFPEQSLSHQIFYFMVMIGVAAGGIVSLCPSFRAVAGFLTLILFPMILNLILYLTLPAMLKALLVFLFWYVTITGAKKINRNIRENIELRHQSINREQILKISEERYRHIFGNAPLGILQYDANGTIIDCNEELIRIVGSSRELLVGFDMPTRLENQELLEALKKSMTTGEG